MCSYTVSLTSAVDRVDGQRHAPVASSLGKGPGTRCTGGRVGHRVGVEGCGKPRL